jgi:glycerol-3-phosphate dehydrogenase
MQRDLDRLRRDEFDLLIVGGGISGACLAHDAALRGLSVALIEKRDFGGATSSASSKLIHGGIRYLQQARIDKVRESAMERAAFQAIAPHLSRYVPFLIPTYPGLARGRATLATAVAIYEWLTAGANGRVPDGAGKVPRASRDQVAAWLRELDALSPRERPTGASAIYESHLHSSERMTLAFLKTASANGAAIANYVEAEAFVRSSERVSGVVARDRLTGREVRIGARLTINAAGPWIDALDRKLGVGPLNRQITGFSRGAHIVTRQVLRDMAIVLPTTRRTQAVVTRGGRHVFVIPWRGCSLIGTSDRPFTGNPDDVQPTAEDVEDLLRDVNDGLPGAGLTRGDVRHAFAGLYPLTESRLSDDVYQGTGDYQIVDHAARDHVQGCMSVLGAKFTTARRLAERATDLAIRKLGRPAVPCATRSTPLVGGNIQDLPALTKAAEARLSRLGPDVVANLVASYGAEIDEATDPDACAPQGLERLTSHRETVESEVAFAVEREMAVCLDDVVFRRTGLGTIGHPGLACLRRCADIIGVRLGWGADHKVQQIRQTERQFPIGAGPGGPVARHGI